MTGLRTDGFDAVVAEAAALARKQLTASEAARVAATLNGRVDEATGLAALSRPERGLLDAMVRLGAGFEGDVDTEGNAGTGTVGAGGDVGAGNDEAADEVGGWWLWLTVTGRLAIRSGAVGAADANAGGYRIGKARWPTAESLAEADCLTQEEHWAERAEFAELAAELAAEPAEAVAERLRIITYSVVHLAPVQIYVGARTYSNLGSRSNLPGKSVAVGAPGSVLTSLGLIAVAEWPVEDAVFVACAAALIQSGAAVRLEEFNGCQLTPAALEAWLRQRLRSYGGPEDDAAPTGAAGGVLSRLEGLARQCAARRSELIRSGTQFYRDIQGINLFKEERALVPPVGSSDIPSDVAEFLRAQVGLAPSGRCLAGISGDLARTLASPAADSRFGTAFEELLHGLLGAVAEATRSDVVMARGPRCLASLAAETASPERILKLATNENYCCVVPSRAFQEHFGEDRESLVKALSAYSARMRYNTWHYLPDSMGLGQHSPGRDDWFFAPALPDITTWSDQHHTGHVMFGVRYAIRVPIGIHFNGAYRPGLYDLRLMRAREPSFEFRHLRVGVAVGCVLADLHQAMAAHRQRILAFDNAWFREFYG